MWLGSEEAAFSAASFLDIADVRNWPLADIYSCAAQVRL